MTDRLKPVALDDLEPDPIEELQEQSPDPMNAVIAAIAQEGGS